MKNDLNLWLKMLLSLFSQIPLMIIRVSSKLKGARGEKGSKGQAGNSGEKVRTQREFCPSPSDRRCNFVTASLHLAIG